ncbi:MAG: tetratricopeptide repeat protein [FCB group bacterium]|nr:tetratricopeptide repeat protein [FCB group bacterium]
MRYFTSIWIILIIILNVSFSQMPTANSPVQQAAPVQPPNPELENAIQKYEALRKKYPGEKSLDYNLGNLKYLKGDYDSAQKDYGSCLDQSDPVKRSEALYNLGNTLVRKGSIEEGLNYYKQALTLNPTDPDIKYNYELSQLMLKQQQQQQQQQSGDKNKQDQKEQQDQSQQQDQQAQKDEGQQQDQEQQQDKQQADQEDEAQQEQDQQQPGDEQQDQENQQKQPTSADKDKQQELDKQEAEAILNTLKANEENMLKKKYRARGRIKVDKDW